MSIVYNESLILFRFRFESIINEKERDEVTCELKRTPGTLLHGYKLVVFAYIHRIREGSSGWIWVPRVLNCSALAYESQEPYRENGIFVQEAQFISV